MTLSINNNIFQLKFHKEVESYAEICFWIRQGPTKCVLGAKSWFSHTCAVKFYLCGKSTFRTQNDTDWANFRYTKNEKYHSYHVRNDFLSPVHLKLALSVTFCVTENQLSAHKTTLAGLIFGIQKTKNIVVWRAKRIFCPPYTGSYLVGVVLNAVSRFSRTSTVKI